MNVCGPLENSRSVSRYLAVFKATWSEEEKKCLAEPNPKEVQRKREADKNPSKKGGHMQSANAVLLAV